MKNYKATADNLYDSAKRKYDPKNVVESVRLFSKCLLYDPTHIEAKKNLIKIFSDGGMTYIQKYYLNALGMELLFQSHSKKFIEKIEPKKLCEEAIEKFNNNDIRFLTDFSNLLMKKSDFSPLCYNYLAIYFAQHKIWDISMHCIKQALILNPNNITTFSNYKQIYIDILNDIKDKNLPVINDYFNFFQEKFVASRNEILYLKEDDILIRAMPDKKYIEALQKEGQMFFRPTEFFRNLEASDPRMDIDENKPLKKILIDNPNGQRIENEIYSPLGFEFISIDARKGSCIVEDMSFSIGGNENIYCFSIISKENINEFIQKYEINKLGKYTLIIENPLKFQKKVIDSLLDKKGVKCGYITYLSKDILEKIGPIYQPYIKKTKYSGEFEYRFSYSSGINDELISIGDISDISTIIETKDLFPYVKKKITNL